MINKENGSVSKILIVVLLVILIIGGSLFYIKYMEYNGGHPAWVNKLFGSSDVVTNGVDGLEGLDENNEVVEVVIPNEPVVEKTVQIFQGDERPIAVMIDNHDGARPQVAINDAYICYEIIVEGGYTRLMPIFKGQDLEKIGPVRSARHYFLDYALEHDAIYVHFGHSPQAASDIKKLKVEDIEGMYYSSSQFTRTSGKYAPHNVIVSTDSILDIAESKKYELTSDKDSVLNYSVDEIELEAEASDTIEVLDAEKVYIPFSYSQDVSFEYDEEKKVYVKYANDKKQVDWVSKEDVTFKNLIVTFAKNYPLNDGSGKDRQGLENIGAKKGYYITNGKAIEITCYKKSRDSQTVYKDLDDNEIEVNDGNTYVGICPLNAKVKITPGKKAVEENAEGAGDADTAGAQGANVISNTVSNEVVE